MPRNISQQTFVSEVFHKNVIFNELFYDHLYSNSPNLQGCRESTPFPPQCCVVDGVEVVLFSLKQWLWF
jgi:hypothetical protein